MLQKSITSLSHHAYLLVGSDAIQADLISMLEKTHKIAAQANPDFYHRVFQILTIDDAREIKSLHQTRPMGETGKKIFILAMNGITTEAQNALLKLLEEPAEYAHFFLIVPSAHLLLPTVRSRMQEIKSPTFQVSSHSKEESNIELQHEAQEFIKLAPAKRLEVIKKLVEDIAKEKKTKQDAIDLVNAIQASIHGTRRVDLRDLRALEAIEVARTYLNDRAPSVKMLLEYVALNI